MSKHISSWFPAGFNKNKTPELRPCPPHARQEEALGSPTGASAGGPAAEGWGLLS